MGKNAISGGGGGRHNSRETKHGYKSQWPIYHKGTKLQGDKISSFSKERCLCLGARHSDVFVDLR